MQRSISLATAARAEFIGTFILVFFGLGAGHVAVFTGELVGLWQVAMVWGLGVATAIYAVGSISGAHINPAITIALAAHDGFPWKRVPAYVIAQTAGAFLAAMLLFGLFGGAIRGFEAAEGITRGAAGSELSAMVYGCYFPNPAAIGTTAEAFAKVTWPQAMVAEVVGTAFLAFFVFAFVDPRNSSRPIGSFTAPLLGLVVAMIICVTAPLTETCLNPARDFGPRLFAYFAGWGSIALPGPRGGFFTVYILAPTIGALLGGGAYRLLLQPAMQGEPSELAKADEIEISPGEAVAEVESVATGR